MAAVGTRRLIFTVGAQCSGKTTRVYEAYPESTNICIDDTPGLYLDVPFGSRGTEQASVVRRLVLDQEQEVDGDELGATIFERDEPTHAECVQLLTKAIHKVRKKYPDLGGRQDALAQEAKVLVKSNLRDAISSSLERLASGLGDEGAGDVVWSNTNASLDAMGDALGVMDEVGFTGEVVIEDLTSVKVSALAFRNVLRSLKTGVYVPIEVILRTHRTIDRDLVSTGLLYDLPQLLKHARKAAQRRTTRTTRTNRR